MPTHLIAKLRHHEALSEEEIARIEGMVRKSVRRLPARADIIREGERPEHVHVILSGWGCRYKVLEDGRRQNMAFFVPGDIFDLRHFFLKRMDHSVGTITPVRLAEIPRDRMLDMTDGSSRVSRSLWWSALMVEACEREWIVNLGQRTSFEHLAHLFCELFMRLRMVGLTRGQECEMPLRQTDLAETAGISSVHVNRVLQDLRSENLIVLKGRKLTIPNLDRLMKVALFNPNYLHLDPVDLSPHERS